MKILLDACVLFPTVLREILQGAGAAGLFEPLWSERILGEWTSSAKKLGPGMDVVAEGEAALFRAAFPRGHIRPQTAIENRLVLPDEDDLHVLAVAIAGHADAIVTFNASDFPRHMLAAEGIERRDPDGFLWELYSKHPEKMGAVLETVRARTEAISGREQELKALAFRLDG